MTMYTLALKKNRQGSIERIFSSFFFVLFERVINKRKYVRSTLEHARCFEQGQLIGIHLSMNFYRGLFRNNVNIKIVSEDSNDIMDFVKKKNNHHHI